MLIFFDIQKLTVLFLCLLVHVSSGAQTQFNTDSDSRLTIQLDGTFASRFIEIAKGSLRWLEQNRGILNYSQLDSYEAQLAHIIANQGKGGSGPIQFVNGKPRDSDGNLKAAVFRLRPNPEILVHRSSWRLWQNGTDSYSLRMLYLVVNLEMLGLAEVPEEDRYHLATKISYHFAEIDPVVLNRKKENLTEPALALTSEKVSRGHPGVLSSFGGKNLSLPMTAVVKAPFWRMNEAFECLKTADLELQTGSGTNWTQNSFVNSRRFSNPTNLLVTLDASHLIDSKRKVLKALLVRFHSEYIQFRISPIDNESSLIEMIPTDVFFEHLKSLHGSWSRAKKDEMAYHFTVVVKDSLSLYLSLRIFHPQNENDFFDFKIQVAQLDQQEELGWFEFSLSKGNLKEQESVLYGKYGSDCPGGGIWESNTLQEGECK